MIASVLKPIDDVRAYWKLSQSIAKTNKYEVNIIGNAGKKHSDVENIKFYPHSISRGRWLKRLLTREHILFQIIKIKPEVLIITTHELINTALIAKLITGCKLVYDVQENYSLNLSHIRPSPIKKLFAVLIRIKEKLSKHFIDQFWLAEDCYREQLLFSKGKQIIIENKAIHFPMNPRTSTPLHLVFTGTISKYGGVERALKALDVMSKDDDQTLLTIIGQIHDSEFKDWLEVQGENRTNLNLILSYDPIPYDEILQAISRANLGVIGYQPTKVNENKIPTKLYEYSNYFLPFLVQHQTLWDRVGTKFGGAISVDFSNLNSQLIKEKLENHSSLFPNEYPREATWEFESVKVINSINKLISNI